MAAAAQVRVHEVEFCGRVKSWMDAIIASHPDWPFERVAIETFGRGSQKRSDLRLFARGSQTPILCGEVKMPGTPEGRSPYDEDLMQDAFRKAENIQSQYFFTWNVNGFVLFDRSRWQVALIERRLKDWDLGLGLRDAAACDRPDVEAAVRDRFLPAFLDEFARIYAGQAPDWALPPDEVFIRTLHSHVQWPVEGTAEYLAERCAADAAFAANLQAWMAGDMGWTFNPKDADDWHAALERAAKTLCYVFCNRAIFYGSLRARFSSFLPPLAMPGRASDPQKVYAGFRRMFENAVRASGDYEPIFYPQVSDWAGSLVFASPKARQGWQGLLASLDEYNFREIPSDILGRIFQKLISPEERQRFGQFFTQDDIVDVINAFCIRRAGDTVLDPACGSGSFLVRAYHRKAWLSEQPGGGQRHIDHGKTHQQLLGEIFGCDIALFPAHLATLNLAARQITQEENYPQVARANFFDAAADRDNFCRIPGPRHAETGGALSYEPRFVALPDLDAVVGNPPYLRQGLIPRLHDVRLGKGESADSHAARCRQTKENLADMCVQAWPGLKLSGRSDLHCYFWPVATGLLREGGYFGFLTSSSWLDAEYGFALQRWVLQNFRLVAVIESVEEPWFEDARIKTAVTILQRCRDAKAREANVVKFVRLEKPLAEILGPRAAGDEAARQRAAQRLRDLIEKTRDEYKDGRLRIIPVPQRRLWEEGVRAAAILVRSPPGEGEAEGDEGEGAPPTPTGMEAVAQSARTYAAGKWGRFLRAPDFYFCLMRQYGHRFVKLGEIAEIRCGIISGCDAFFMPRDATAEVLARAKGGEPWQDIGLMAPCPRREVESGRVRIVRAGDGTLHPVEAEYVRPEVQSPMQVDRPVIRAPDLDRVVLWVGKPLEELAGSYAARYIRWGSRQTFESNKSKSVPVPKRISCAARPLWYDLTGGKVGMAFWPMAQHYRHIIPANPESLVCNHNLFYVSAKPEDKTRPDALVAVLNCTIVGLIKTYYGRYAGTEGNLKTEVVDVNLLDVPDPRGISARVLKRLRSALLSMQGREVGRLVEEAFMNCHTAAHVKQLAETPLELSAELRQADRRELDDAVLEMIGIGSARERAALLDELYLETARHYRRIRIVEVQKMEQRSRASGAQQFTAQDLAEGIWDSLAPDEKRESLLAWLASAGAASETISIPEGKPVANGAGHLFEPRAVVFRSAGARQEVVYSSVEQAALVAALAELGVRGKVTVPAQAAACRQTVRELAARLAEAQRRFEELAASRTGTPALQDRTAELLVHWFIHGRQG
jgi:hypothetical protein